MKDTFLLQNQNPEAFRHHGRIISKYAKLRGVITVGNPYFHKHFSPKSSSTK